MLAGACSLGWLASILAFWGVLPLAGALPLDLYRFFSLAAILGWLAGNVYRFRQRGALESPVRRRAVWLYLIGPPSFLYLLRAMAPLLEQQAAPLVPIYGFGVYGLFFLIPLTLRGTLKY